MLVKQFQSAEGAAAFLISLKAGGFGLNLTAASGVVLFDPWWNPAENQAIEKTHETTRILFTHRDGWSGDGLEWMPEFQGRRDDKSYY